MAIAISITPTSFNASQGKLQSSSRYIRRSVTPNYFMIGSRNMDVSNGALRYISANGVLTDTGGYNGGFTSIISIGIKV